MKFHFFASFNIEFYISYMNILQSDLNKVKFISIYYELYRIIITI